MLRRAERSRATITVSYGLRCTVKMSSNSSGATRGGRGVGVVIFLMFLQIIGRTKIVYLVHAKRLIYMKYEYYSYP